MSVTGKLLALAEVARSVYGRWRLQRLLSGILLIAGLTIITSGLLCATLMSGFYAIYLTFLHYGFETEQALLLVMCIMIFTMALLVMAVQRCLRRLNEIPKRMLMKSPVVARASVAVDAFVDGFFAEENH